MICFVSMPFLVSVSSRSFCSPAESAVSRWYREYAVHLVRVGELAEARTCEALSQVKTRHAQVLGAWVELLPPRGG